MYTSIWTYHTIDTGEQLSIQTTNSKCCEHKIERLFNQVSLYFLTTNQWPLKGINFCDTTENNQLGNILNHYANNYEYMQLRNIEIMDKPTWQTKGLIGSGGCTKNSATTTKKLGHFIRPLPSADREPLICL